MSDQRGQEWGGGYEWPTWPGVGGGAMSDQRGPWPGGSRPELGACE